MSFEMSHKNTSIEAVEVATVLASRWLMEELRRIGERAGGGESVCLTIEDQKMFEHFVSVRVKCRCGAIIKVSSSSVDDALLGLLQQIRDLE